MFIKRLIFAAVTFFFLVLGVCSFLPTLQDATPSLPLGTIVLLFLATLSLCMFCGVGWSGGIQINN